MDSRRISAARALARLNDTGILTDAVVVGALRFAGQTISKRIVCENVVFAGIVDFSDCVAEGRICFTDCVFQRRFDATGAHFQSALEFHNCMVLSSIDADFVPPDRPFSLASANVDGNLLLIDLTLRGQCDLSSITVEGSTALAGLDIANAHQVHALIPDPGSFDMLPNSGWLNMRNGRFIGGLAVRPMGKDDKRRQPKIAARMDLRDADIDGLLVMTEVEIGEQLSLIGTKLGALAVFDRCRIGGDFDLSVTSQGQIRIQGTMVSGKVSVITSPIDGGLRIEAHEGEDPARPCVFGALLISGAKIRSGLNLPGLVIVGSQFEPVSLLISGSEIIGNLSFVQEKSGVSPRVGSAMVAGAARLSNVQIRAGDLNLGGIAATDIIDLTNTHVEGDLKIAPRPASDDGATDTLASARGLVAPGLTVGKDMDISGLKLAAFEALYPGKPTPEQERYAGAVVAPRLCVAGKLVMAPEDGRDGEHLSAPGGIRLARGEINHMIVSGRHTDGAAPSPEGATHELDLSGAEIKIFEVHTRGAAEGEVYPSPLNLQDATVGTWRTDGKRMAAPQFLGLLDGLAPFSRSTYLQADKFLRAGGHDEEANDVFVAMRDAAARVEQSRDGAPALQRAEAGLSALSHLLFLPVAALAWALAPIFSWLWWAVARFLRDPLHRSFKFLLGFGTNPMPLLGVILALYVISVFAVLHDERNIQPTLAYRAATGGQISDTLTPDPAAWNFSQRAVLGLRYHIPLAVIPALDDWEARDEAPLYLPDSVCGTTDLARSGASYAYNAVATTPWVPVWHAPGQCALFVGSAQDWTTAMSILNYIMWPLLLTFLIRRLLRD